MDKIYMLHGKAQSGKNYCSNYLKAHFELEDKKVLEIAFADYVRFCLREYYHVTDYKTPEGRSTIQHFATDLVRKKLPDFWARTVTELLYAIQDEWDIVLITDWRFPNEYAVLKRYFGNKVVPIEIRRKNLALSDGMTEDQRQHESENALNDFTEYMYRIENNDTVMESLDKIIKKELGQ